MGSKKKSGKKVRDEDDEYVRSDAEDHEMEYSEVDGLLLKDESFDQFKRKFPAGERREQELAYRRVDRLGTIDPDNYEKKIPRPERYASYLKKDQQQWVKADAVDTIPELPQNMYQPHDWEKWELRILNRRDPLFKGEVDPNSHRIVIPRYIDRPRPANMKCNMTFWWRQRFFDENILLDLVPDHQIDNQIATQQQAQFQGGYLGKKKAEMKALFYRVMIEELNHEKNRRLVRGFIAYVKKKKDAPKASAPSSQRSDETEKLKSQLEQLRKENEALKKKQTETGESATDSEALFKSLLDAFHTNTKTLIQSVVKKNPLLENLVATALDTKVKPFKGYDAIKKNKDSLNQWFTQMDTSFNVIKSSGEAEKLTDEIKISLALTRVDNDVNEWMHRDIVPTMSTMTWETFVQKIHERYDPLDVRLVPYMAITELSLASDNVKGDVDKLIHEYEKILRRTTGFNEDAKIAFLRKALAPCPKLLTTLESKVPCKTFEEEKKVIREKAMLLAAKKQGERNQYVVAITTCTVCGGYHEASTCKLRGKGFKQIPEVPHKRGDRDRSRDRGRHGDRDRDRRGRGHSRDRGKDISRMSRQEIKDLAKQYRKDDDAAYREKEGREKYIQKKRAELENQQYQLAMYEKQLQPKKDPNSSRSRKANEYHERKKKKIKQDEDGTPPSSQ